MKRAAELVVLLHFLALLPVAAQVPDTAVDPPGSELTVYLMTMGQGDEVWERFGHNAIGIRNARTGSDVVYNWGLFSFDQPGFIGRFLQGDMQYWMGGYDAASTVAAYRAANRTVEVQELNLSPPQRLALLEFIRWNEQEENRYYRYDYFLDNCSTRVRDALDRVLGGALRMGTDSIETTNTWRDHALRLLAEDHLTTVGVDIGLGRPTDRPLTGWEEMFIPMKVRDYVRLLRVPDETGALVPLVTSERVLVRAERKPERSTPPSLGAPLLALGAALAGLLLWLGQRGATGARGAGMAATAMIAVWCLLIGVLGAALSYLRFFTLHQATYDNTNIFVYNPVWLLVLVVLPFARTGFGRRTMYVLATLAGVLSVAGLVLLFVPGFAQQSVAVALLAVPVNLVAAGLLRQRTRVVRGPLN